MNGLRFYEELEHKDRKGERSRGTVFAAIVENGIFWGNPNRDARYEGISAAYDYPDSPVCTGAASLDYLRHDCRRISEARARQIHPTLFFVLDQLCAQWEAGKPGIL